MAFKCLAHSHRIFVGLVLSWKEEKGETPTCSGGSYRMNTGEWGLWNTPEGNPGQSSSVASTALACLQRVSMRKEK